MKTENKLGDYNIKGYAYEISNEKITAYSKIGIYKII